MIALLGEIQDTIKRESSVNAAYTLLKKNNADTISPLLLQFAFWVRKTSIMHVYILTNIDFGRTWLFIKHVF